MRNAAQHALRAAAILRRYKALPRAHRLAVWKRVVAAITVGADAPPGVSEWDLQIANLLDRMHEAIATGADETVLHLANELDAIDAAVREQARRVGGAIDAKVWLWGGMAVAVLLAAAYARRSGHASE